MERKTVRSSNVKSVGYNDCSFVLQIEFKSGAIYNYFNVPLSVAEALMEAESVGRHLNEFIQGHYKFQRVLN